MVSHTHIKCRGHLLQPGTWPAILGVEFPPLLHACGCLARLVLGVGCVRVGLQGSLGRELVGPKMGGLCPNLDYCRDGAVFVAVCAPTHPIFDVGVVNPPNTQPDADAAGRLP